MQQHCNHCEINQASSSSLSLLVICSWLPDCPSQSVSKATFSPRLLLNFFLTHVSIYPLDLPICSSDSCCRCVTYITYPKANCCLKLNSLSLSFSFLYYYCYISTISSACAKSSIKKLSPSLASPLSFFPALFSSTS